MTAKEYFRQKELKDLGFPMDDIYIELNKYINERLSNLKRYGTEDERFNNNILYCKTKNIPIFLYSESASYICLFYENFTKKLNSKFDLHYHDLSLILIPIITEKYKIKINYIYIDWLELRQLIGDEENTFKIQK